MTNHNNKSKVLQFSLLFCAEYFKFYLYLVLEGNHSLRICLDLERSLNVRTRSSTEMRVIKGTCTGIIRYVQYKYDYHPRNNYLFEKFGRHTLDIFSS